MQNRPRGITPRYAAGWLAAQLAVLISVIDSADAQRRPTSARFIENRGQWPGSVCFLQRSGGVTAHALSSGLLLDLRVRDPDQRIGVAVRVEFGVATPEAPIGERLQPGLHHWFIGDDPARWARDAYGFGSVRYPCIRDGIDLVLREQDGHLEYDLELSPGANLDEVVFTVEGALGLALSGNGALIVHTDLGDLIQSPPVSHELLPNGERLARQVTFRLLDGGRFGFASPERDLGNELLIDPGLVWSTYLGGSAGLEVVYASKFDPNGGIALTGQTDNYAFPSSPGAYVSPGPSGTVAFVTRLAPDGSLVYSSLISPSYGSAVGNSVAIDGLGRIAACGNVYISAAAGTTFPTTAGAFDTHIDSFNTAGFVLRLAPQGNLLEFSSLVEGGPDGSEANAIVMASSGATLVAGSTGSTSFPTTPNAFDTTFNTTPNEDGFVLRLDPTGSFLEWSTLIGGSSRDWVQDLELDAAGNVTVLGATSHFYPQPFDFPLTPGAYISAMPGNSYGCFVTRLNPQGSALLWSTFLATNHSDWNYPLALALEPDGGVCVTAIMQSTLLYTTQGAFSEPVGYFPALEAEHSIVARLDPTGSHLVYSTYLGSRVRCRDLAVDASGVVTLVGIDIWGNLALTPGAWGVPHTWYNGSFVARLDPYGTRAYYAGYWSVAGQNAATTMVMLDPHRVAFAGWTTDGLPTTPGAFDTTFNGGSTDAFVAALDLYLQGISPLGSPGQSCRGPITMNATAMPSAGSPEFGFYCSGAPPFTNGWLLLGTAAATPSTVQGASLLLDPSKRITRLPVMTNYAGFVETQLPLHALTPGMRFAAQYVFRNTPACGGSGALNGSHGLIVDVQ